MTTPLSSTPLSSTPRLSTRLRRAATLVVALVTALGLVVGIGGCSVLPSKQMTVVAYFSDAAGLFEGNDVGILGVTVGKVTSIQPAGDRVKVTMTIDGGQPVPAGAAAVIVSRSVATDRYVELTPVYQGGARMQSGAVIPLDRTRTPVEFDKVLSTLGDFARGISGSKGTAHAISDFLGTQAAVLNGKGPLINQTIRTLSDASNGISAQRGNATSTLVALDRLTGTLATNQKTVRRFVRQVADATALLAAERGNFKTALRSATRMIRVVAEFARTNRAAIRHAVNRTDDTLRTVLAHRRQTAEVLRVMPLTVQNLQRILRAQDGRLAVRLDWTGLLPVIGPVLSSVCSGPLNNACTLLGLDPGGLLSLLGGLLGGRP